MQKHAFIATLGLLMPCAWAGVAQATTIEIGPGDDIRSTMQGLQAGDTLILDGGTYTLSSYFAISLAGTSGLPIVIRAKTGEQPVIHYVDNSQNIINIGNTTFLTFDGIEFTGGSRGLRFLSGTSDITVRNCHVHDTDANAISANDGGVDYARFTFEHNEIDHTGGTGEAFYLGCNSNACQFHDSLVANNYIHDLNGATITQGDGIEIKQGSYANIVRDNVIHDTAYPGITLYDVARNGAPNVIERNLVWNSGDNGIQVTADAIVRNNIVLGECAGCSAFAANNLQGATPANLTIVNNTFIAPDGNGVKLNSVSGSIIIANNAIYAPNGNAISASGTLGGITSVANAGQGTLNGVAAGFATTGNLATDFFGANLGGVPPQNLVPRGSLLVGMANATYLPSDDFDLRARSAQADIGAYLANANGNPGWPLRAGFKILDEIFVGDFEPWQ
ncbi:MAG: right-handed parallel beta-helix repeat-containing protein [Proteobacteria bacterium]|nr:right-handed parallel beta-helix repeat-containing protein [Pseudomonadota bacterium]